MYSGNGNDFTATGFDTQVKGNFSGQIVSSSGSWNSGRGPTNAFDGSTASITQVLSEGATITFTPATPISYNSLHFYTYGATWELNESTTGGALSDTSWVTVDAGPGVLTSLKFLNDGGGQAAISAIAINGTGTDNILVDGLGTDYDLMQDSPTQNFATLNPIFPAISSPTTYTNANLTGVKIFTTNISPISTVAFDAQSSYYFEFTRGSLNTQFAVLFQNPNNVIDAPSGIPGLSQPNTISFYAANTSQAGVVYRDGTQVGGTLPLVFASGDLCRVACSPLGVWIGIGDQWIQNVGGTFTAVSTFPSTNPTVPALDDSPALMSVASFTEVASDGASNNYGQQPFLHTPPAGFEALQTQNMPTPAILDGRDHFRAITGPGSGTVGPNEIAVNPYTNPTGYLDNPPPYPPSNAFNTNEDLWFYVPINTDYTETAIQFDPPMTGTTFNIYVSIGQSGFQVNGTTISGNRAGWFDISTQAAGSLSTLGFSASSNNADGFSRLQIDGKDVVEPGILPKAQQTFPNALWWIKSRVNDANTTQHMFVDSVRGQVGGKWQKLNCPNINSAEQDYTPPAGSSVAWCWNAGGAAVTNNDGTIESQVAANTEAGFSVISYTGNNTTDQSVGHGLSRAPEFVIAKTRDQSNSIWVIYSQYTQATTPADQYLILNTAEAAVTDSEMWKSQPTNTVVNLGRYSNNNDAGRMIMYAWHSVPGYSSFGSYQGNEMQTMRLCSPESNLAWFIIKASSTASWLGKFMIRQEALTTQMTLFCADSALAETTGFDIDILSNGFKMPSCQWTINGSWNRYIYAAFASCPFQSPATAR